MRSLDHWCSIVSAFKALALLCQCLFNAVSKRSTTHWPCTRGMNIKPAPSALVRPNRSESNVERLLEIVTRSFWRWMELPVVRDSANYYWTPVIKHKRKENISKSVIWLYIGFYIKYLDYKCIIFQYTWDFMWQF